MFAMEMLVYLEERPTFVLEKIKEVSIVFKSWTFPNRGVVHLCICHNFPGQSYHPANPWKKQ